MPDRSIFAIKYSIRKPTSLMYINSYAKVRSTKGISDTGKHANWVDSPSQSDIPLVPSRTITNTQNSVHDQSVIIDGGSNGGGRSLHRGESRVLFGCACIPRKKEDGGEGTPPMQWRGGEPTNIPHGQKLERRLQLRQAQGIQGGARTLMSRK